MLNEYPNSRQAEIRQRAENLFERSWLSGQLKRLRAVFTGEKRVLPYLGGYTQEDFEVVERLERQPVRLTEIYGTASRVDRFDIDFHPITRRMKQRWISAAAALMQDPTALPPLELVKIDDTYYVIDGHHRVSAARALGRLFVDADITVWRPRSVSDGTGHP